MNKFLTCVLLVVVFAVSCKKDTVISDDQADYFLKVFGGSSSDICSSLISTDNNLYLTGSLKYQDNTNMFLIKTDKFGNQLSGFPKYLGSVGVGSTGFDIATDQDNNLIVAGNVQSAQGDTSRVFVVKTNSNGDVLWSKRFGGGKNNSAYSIYSSSNLIYIAGYTEGVNYPSRGRQGWLLALSQNGDSIWSNDYGISGVSDELHDIVDFSDSLLLVGSSQSIIDNGRYDVLVFILKKTTHGIENSKTFYKSGNEMGVSAVKTPSNTIYVLGYSIASDKNTIYIWKLDDGLNIVAEGAIQSDVSETPSSILYDNGNIVVVGTANEGSNKENFLVYKLDADLKVLSRGTYGTWENQKAKTAVIDNNGIIIGGGVSTSNSSSKACIYKTPW
jgi:hypothetical protein